MAKIPFRPRPEGESNLCYNQVLRNHRTENKEPLSVNRADRAAQAAFDRALNRLEAKKPHDTVTAPRAANSEMRSRLISVQPPLELSEQKPLLPKETKESASSTVKNDNEEADVQRVTTSDDLQCDTAVDGLLVENLDGHRDEHWDEFSDKQRDDASTVGNGCAETLIGPIPLRTRSETQSGDLSFLSSAVSQTERVESVEAVWKHVSGMEARSSQKQWHFTLLHGSTASLGLTLVSTTADSWQIILHSGAEKHPRLNQCMDELKTSLENRGEVIESMTVMEDGSP